LQTQSLLLTIKGPAGKFSCFNYPAAKMLFVGAGSGITPLMAMSRWIVDTTSDVDVKLLASFKSPSDIIFRKELELISARHSRFQIAVTLTSGWRGTESWTGFAGDGSTNRLSACWRRTLISGTSSCAARNPSRRR